MPQYTELVCGQCKVAFCLNDDMLVALKQSSATFYCPWGHPRHFPQGPSAEDILRRERDRVKQEAARLTDVANEAQRARESAERRASAARGQVTRLKRSTAAGVCPCCAHGFPNLKRHIEAKHPEFVAEAVEGESTS